jgi:hypothetical protein
MIQYLGEILKFDNRNRSLGSIEGQFLEYFAGYPSLSAYDLISLYESTRDPIIANYVRYRVNRLYNLNLIQRKREYIIGLVQAGFIILYLKVDRAF